MAHPDRPTVGGKQAMTDTWGHRGKASKYQGSLLGAVVATAQLCFKIMACFCDSQMLDHLEVQLTSANWTVASWVPCYLLRRQGRLVQS